jgi:hypothetical protein
MTTPPSPAPVGALAIDALALDATIGVASPDMPAAAILPAFFAERPLRSLDGRCASVVGACSLLARAPPPSPPAASCSSRVWRMESCALNHPGFAGGRVA